MPNGTATASALVGVAVAAVTACTVARRADITSLLDFPAEPGVAGAFAGTFDGQLIAGGGANFPDGRMPWDGGRKVWHDGVFALDLNAAGATWRHVGRLPAPNGYGVSLTTPDGVLVIGGGDADRHFADVWLMRLDGGRTVFHRLPPLPKPTAQMAGTLVGRVVHIVGGIEDPLATNASSAHWALDLDDTAAGWKSLAPLPAPGRILAAAAVIGDALLVFGGCSLAPDAGGRPRRTYLRDAWKFTHGEWARLADMPRASAGAASPAPTDGKSVFVVSGDDGTQMDASPADHRGFTQEVLRYDLATDSWRSAGALDVAAPVTLPSVPWGDSFIFVSGEVRPGVRTRNVFAFRPRDLE